MRGDNLQQLLEENKNDRPLDNEFNICLSQETERIRRLDEEYKKQMVQDDLQQLQSTVLPKIENSAGSKYHELVGIANNILNAIGDNKKLYEKYYMQLKDIETKCVQECIYNDKKRIWRTQQVQLNFRTLVNLRRKLRRENVLFMKGKNVINRKRLKSRYNIIESDELSLISFLQVIITHLHHIDNTFV